ncbi:MAG: tRNA lysidine(34) synthetase TilS [Clostridia bacterium]|nr:tRNA lysidine(34) synthetase TilS [Clostridia bacterium]
MLENEVLNTIQKYNMIQENDTIVVAVSGGPDSMTLLNVLLKIKNKLKFKIVVAHVNHMIRAVADSETQYVKDFCEKNSIECYIKKIDVIKKSELEKISTEEAGRNARYDFFEEIFNKVQGSKIAIAHNKNDNAETVLMNFMRGTGVSGLKGIEPVRNNKFIRPLIEINRKDIEQYCIDENLNPKFDESNNENIYTRNKIRNLLIPYLKKEFNPNIVDSINRLSELASQENKYIEKIVNKSFEDIKENIDNNNIVLNLKKFNLLDSFIKSKIILLCVKKLFNSTKGVEKIHIEDIIKLCEKNVGNKYLTPNKNLKVAINKGKIIISKISN